MSDRGPGRPEQTGKSGPLEAAAMPEIRRHLARLVLVVFLITFTVIRILVFLIMNRAFPDMFVYIGGTHVHHMNLGIFLLSGVGACLLFTRPKGRRMDGAAILYGIGLALTFDEFGMWLHLGGGYWQRASFDAITVVGGLLVLLAFAPPARQIRGRHAVTVLLLMLLGAVFFYLLYQTVNKYGGKVGPRGYRPRPAEKGDYSQSEAVSGTDVRATRLSAPRAQLFRQMPQP